MPTTTAKRKMTLEDRRERHRIALVKARMTQLAFCRQIKRSVNHVNEVLRGKRESPYIAQQLEKFAARHLD